LIKLGKVDAADRVMEQLKTLGVDGSQIKLLQAEKYYAGGAAVKALASLTEVAAASNNTPSVHYYAGLLFLKLNKLEQAQREFERELILDPHDAHAKYSLGEVLLGGTQVERGIVLLREVVQDLPEHGQARYALGNALLRKGDLTGAIENLERASQLEPEQPDIHYQLGQAYLAAGRKVDGKNQIDISKQLRSRSQTTSNDK